MLHEHCLIIILPIDLHNINSEVNQAFQVSTAQSMNIIAKGISQTGYGAFFSLYGTGTINLDVSGVIPYLGNFSLFGSAYPGCSFTNISNYTPPVHAAPASGTVTLINNMGYQRLILSPTGAFTLSWPNPTNGPTNGEIVELMFATGGFTVTNTSGTVLGMPAAPGAGFGGSFIYDATTTKWLYRG